jgi:hypothetical protein
MGIRNLSRLACAGAALTLVACGSSPTEPDASSMVRQTTLRMVVTACNLGGSIEVGTEMGVLGTLPTPGEATFHLPPGPHALTYRRGNETFGGALLPGDPLGQVAPGATASIVVTDPPGVCMTSAH